ncbi:unnamed protein product, partial [Staurois parvus]
MLHSPIRLCVCVWLVTVKVGKAIATKDEWSMPRGGLTTHGPLGNRGSWGPCVLAQTQKAYEKGTRGISWGTLLTPGSRAVPKFPNGQSVP